MASSLVESLAAPFEPARFEDDYKAALEALIDAKLTGGEVRSIEPGAAKDDDADLDDLVSALRRSVDAAKARSGSRSGSGADSAAKATSPKTATKKAPAKSAAKKTTTAKKAPAKKPAAKTSTTKTAAAKKAPGKKTTTAKATSTRRSA